MVVLVLPLRRPIHIEEENARRGDWEKVRNRRRTASNKYITSASRSLQNEHLPKRVIVNVNLKAAWKSKRRDRLERPGIPENAY